VRQVVINWPRLVVDSVEERLDVEGFRFPGEPASDAELWRIWQANDMDEQSQQGHLDSLVMGRAYVVIGVRGDDDTDAARSRSSRLSTCSPSSIRRPARFAPP
jgi:hypothetical protein